MATVGINGSKYDMIRFDRRV